MSGRNVYRAQLLKKGYSPPMSLIGNRDNSHHQMDNQREIIEEFLIESNESLAQLDLDFVALEERPDDQDLLSSIFRAIHTIKGVSGFLGFTTLGAITHHAENILSQLRDGDRKLTHELTDLLLETFDAVKRILAEIESTSEEGDDDCKELVARLETACNVGAVEESDDEATDQPDREEEVTAAPPLASPERRRQARRVRQSRPSKTRRHNRRVRRSLIRIFVSVSKLSTT